MASAVSNEEHIVPIDRQHITLIETPPKTSPGQAISLLINAAVGAGVLSLPWAFRCAGWAGGTLILLLVAVVESYTLYILSRWAESTKASSYGELVHCSLGPLAAAALSIIIFLYLFGSGVAYLVILGDCFHPLLTHVFGSVWYTSRQAAISAIGTCIILPMCFAQSLSAAAGISAVNFAAFVLVIAAILARSISTIATAEVPFIHTHAFHPSWAAAIPIAVFGLQCHAQVVAVFNELQDEDELQEETQNQAVQRSGGSFLSILEQLGGRKQKSKRLLGMTKVIIAAIACTAFGYLLVGIFAYLAFPTTLKSNVLNTFPPSDTLIQVLRAVVGVLEIASYPVNHLPARAAVRDAAFTAAGVTLGGWNFIVAETLCFYLGTLVLALLVQDVGSVFSLVGGLCGSAMILGMPGLLLMKYAWDKHNLPYWSSPIDMSAHSTVLNDPLLISNGEARQSSDELEYQEVSELPTVVGVYNALYSKFLWSGAVLVASCIALMLYTVHICVLF